MIADPVALRDRLFEAVGRDDLNGLTALCRANRDAIRRSYAVWLKPDREFIGSDPRRVDWYGRNLLGIGQCFAQILGDPGYQLVGLPAVEIYQTTQVNVRYRLNHTDLCLPVVACS